MDKTASLTLAQKFKLQQLTNDAKKLTKEQAQDYVIELIRQSFIKDNLMKDMLRGGF